MGRKAIISQVMKFFKASKIDPEKLIAEWKDKRFDWAKREAMLADLNEAIESYFLNDLEDYSPMTKRTQIFRIISFFKRNKIPIEPDLGERADRVYVKYHNRDIQREEIRKICEHSLLKYRTFYIVMAESGARPYTLTRLKYRHIKEDFEAGRVPMGITLPSELLKDNVGDRFTFIGQDGFRLLKEYLSSRGPLKDDDLIFARDVAGHSEDEPLSTSTFSTEFSNVIKQLGMVESKDGKPKELRLYCLRKWFRNKWTGDRDYREFLMGHSSTLAIDQSYITRDKELHRLMYEQSYPSIRIYGEQAPETSARVAELGKALESRNEEIKELREKVNAIDKMIQGGSLQEAFIAFYGEFLTKSREEIKQQVLKELEKDKRKD
jgi:integrase